MSNSNEFDEHSSWESEVDDELDDTGVEVPLAPTSSPDAIPMPVQSENRQIATSFAAQQKMPEKAEQVRRNMLAVLVVRDYLRFQGYSSNLETSNCWNQLRRQLDDVADLMISSIGRLECRVFDAEQELCPIPDEVQFDRVSYVGVQFDVDEQWAWLLGFMPALSVTEPVEGIRRAELYSMDEFGAHLYRLQVVSQILDRKPEQVWEPGVREAAIALIERMYLTVTEPYLQPSLTAREILALTDVQFVEMSEVSTLSGTEREQAQTAGETLDELSDFLYEVFDELRETLENGE